MSRWFQPGFLGEFRPATIRVSRDASCYRTATDSSPDSTRQQEWLAAQPTVSRSPSLRDRRSRLPRNVKRNPNTQHGDDIGLDLRSVQVLVDRDLHRRLHDPSDRNDLETGGQQEH